MLRSARQCLILASAKADPWKSIIVRFSHAEVKIPVPWGHVAGKWWNKDNRRPILAVHGWQDNANSFDYLVPLMESKLPVLAIDLPGHGRSSHFPSGFNYHHMSAVSTLRRIVEHYGWKNTSLMGHSLGGQTCFLYAAMYPDQVDAVICLDILTPMPFNVERFVKQGGKDIDNFLKRDSQKLESAPAYSYDQLVKLVMQSPFIPVNEEAAQCLIARGSVKDAEGKYRFTRDTKLKGPPLAGWPARELLTFCSALETNILCIKAEASSYFCTKEFFEECWAIILKVAKAAELKYVPGNHHVHLENAKIVAPIVNDFLLKHCALKS